MRKIVSLILLTIILLASSGFIKITYADNTSHSINSIITTYRDYGGSSMDALGTINFIRYLSGVPNDVKTSTEYNSLAYWAASANAKNNVLSHAPYKPSSMSSSQYRAAYEGASKSNLNYSSVNISPTNAVIAMLQDDESYNIPDVGHRRWILNPKMKYTGLGEAYSVTGGDYFAMYAFDESRRDSFSYSRISWPNGKYFPVEYMTYDDPWSVSLNPSIYNANYTNSIYVTLQRINDGAKWVFSYGGSSGYFNINKENYAIPFCIIFRPQNISYSPGQTYRVTISNVYKGNSLTSISYDITFFSLNSLK